MMPSTGPKYSVVWNALPGLTPVRMPGDQRRPDASSCCGSTSHVSPSSSVVSALSSLPWAGSMIGLITVVGSSGHPTASDVTASTSWRAKRSDVPTEPTRIARDAAEHFCPAWPNALFDEVGDREVEVGARRDDDGVLAARLGQQRQVGAPRAEQRGGLPGAGEDDAVDVGVRDERLAERALVDGDEAQHLARDAGLPQRLGHDGGAAPACGRRLEDDAAARGERGEHAAGRDRDREVPRRRDDGQRAGSKPAPSTPSRRSADSA